MPASFRTILRRRRAPAPKLVEALESRLCFDLSPVSVTGLPVNLIATVATHATVTVNLKNTGLATIKGPYSAELWISPDGQMAGAAFVTLKNETLPALHAGHTLAVKIPIGALPDVTGENYSVIVQIQGTLAGADDATAVSAKQIAVAAPFVDLAAKIGYSGKTTLIPTQSTAIAVTVYNYGNVPANGPLEIDLGSSFSSDGSGAAVTQVENETIKIAPGHHVTYNFARPVALHTQPDVYFATASVDPNNTFSDPFPANNTGVSLKALTVLDPYADIVGTDVGTFKVTHGTDKGERGILTFTISQESVTLATINGLGSDSIGDSFSVNGTFAVNNTITMQTDDLSTGTFIVYDGKVSKNKITGTFHETTGTDTGTFLLEF